MGRSSDGAWNRMCDRPWHQVLGRGGRNPRRNPGVWRIRVVGAGTALDSLPTQLSRVEPISESGKGGHLRIPARFQAPRKFVFEPVGGARAVIPPYLFAVAGKPLHHITRLWPLRHRPGSGRQIDELKRRGAGRRLGPSQIRRPAEPQ